MSAWQGGLHLQLATQQAGLAKVTMTEIQRGRLSTIGIQPCPKMCTKGCVKTRHEVSSEEVHINAATCNK